MADDKRGRDKQAQDADRRQRTRDVEAALERGDEPEPPIEAAAVAEIESALDALAFPATGAEVVAAVGDRELEAPTGRYTVDTLVPDTDVETFDSPRAVRDRLQRPTVAAAMKRIAEASTGLPDQDRFGSQRDAYLRTFLELEAIDTMDDDAVVRAVADWVVEQIDENEKLPSSRAVRRHAAKHCRANGYRIRDTDWLGV